MVPDEKACPARVFWKLSRSSIGEHNLVYRFRTIEYNSHCLRLVAVQVATLSCLSYLWHNRCHMDAVATSLRVHYWPSTGTAFHHEN